MFLPAAPLAAAVLLAAAAASPQAKQPPAAAQSQPTVAARVNGVAIPAARLVRELASWRAQLEAAGNPPDAAAAATARRELLDRFIATELIFQLAEQAKILPAEADIAAEVDKVRAQFEKDSTFEEALRQEGMTAAGLRDEIRRELTVRRWVEENIDRTTVVADREVRAYYDSHPEEFERPEALEVAHILVRVPAGSSVAVKAGLRRRAAEALDRVRGGEDFAVVAREVSEDEKTAPDGGRIGPVLPGRSLPEFETAAFALEPGQVSDLVETPFGFHVIRVLGKLAKGVLDFAEVEPRLREFLVTRAKRDRLQQAVAELRKRATVEVY